MDDALINRHNIINLFHQNLKNLKISDKRNDDHITFYIPDLLEVKRYINQNVYEFSMMMKGYVSEEVWDGFNSYFPSGNGYVKVTKEVSNMVNVIRYDGSFKMVSTTNDDNWIFYDRRQAITPSYKGYNTEVSHSLCTNLNIGFQKLPVTEEEHFQRITTDELVLELEYCLKFKEIIDFINSIGTIVKPNPDLQIYLLFKGNLSGDA